MLAACQVALAIDKLAARQGRTSVGSRSSLMELEMGDRLVVGGARLPCAQHRAAIEELTAREIHSGGSPVELVYGDGDAVLAHLAGRAT